MTNINRSVLLPSIDSFQSSIPFTSTPKRSTTKSQPLSSTLSISTNSCWKMDLSISAITFIKKSSSSHQRKRRRYHYYQRRMMHLHSSKRIELKHLLYATRAMKTRSMKPSYDDNDVKIYVI